MRRMVMRRASQTSVVHVGTEASQPRPTERRRRPMRIRCCRRRVEICVEIVGVVGEMVSVEEELRVFEMGKEGVAAVGAQVA